jgi:DNA primase
VHLQYVRNKPHQHFDRRVLDAGLSPWRGPERFTMITVPDRLARLRTDPWKASWTTAQTIPHGAIAALNRL